MSKDLETLVFLANSDELRVVSGRVTDAFFHISETASFWSRGSDKEASPLTDQTVLDSLAELAAQKDWRGKDVICLLGGAAVSCHYFDMPPLKGTALTQAALLKLGQQLHFNLTEAIVDIRPLADSASLTAGQIRVSAAAARKDHCVAAIDVAERLGLRIRAVTAASAALTELAMEVFAKPDELQTVLCIDEHVSTLIVLKGTTPCVNAEMSIGLADMTAALMRPIISSQEVIQLEESKAAELRNRIGIPAPDQAIDSLGITGGQLLPLMEPVLQSIVKQMTQWLTFAVTGNKANRPKHFKFIGPGAAIPGLGAALGQRLRMEVETPNWLTSVASFDTPTSSVSLDSLASAIGAARHWELLPDLSPPEYRKRRKLIGVRRSVAICGPFIAAALFAVALLFKQTESRVRPVLDDNQTQLIDLQKLVQSNQSFGGRQQKVNQMQKDLDTFAGDSPLWSGVFKELSVVLPSEVQAVEFQADTQSSGMRVVLTANVISIRGGRSFDEVVEELLIALQRSPFFGRVQLVNSNRANKEEQAKQAGALTVEMTLKYPGAKLKA